MNTNPTLLVVYHRPFWRAADGSLWEREGAFSRYLESLSPHFERILIAAPETRPPPNSAPSTEHSALSTLRFAESDNILDSCGVGQHSALETQHSMIAGHRLAVTNVELAPLPFFDGLPGFLRVLPGALLALWKAVGSADLVNVRLPTPAGSLAYGLARLRRRPVFLLVVGDLAGAAQSVPADSLRRRLYHIYVRFEERLLQAMVERSLTITNGRALYEKHARPGRPIFETRNSTIRLADVGRPRLPYEPPHVRLLCVSRIDPRKGLRHLPAALDALRRRGFEPTLDVLGPVVGRLGEQERLATLEAARRLGLGEAVRFQGAASIEQVYAAYTEHDLLVVPSLPGEGVPRVLLEAMAAGLPLVATSVAGIPDLVRSGQNGLLAPQADGTALGSAAACLLEDTELRATCVAGGYATARQHTADTQASWLHDLVSRHLLNETRHPSPRITIPLAGLNLSGGVKSLLLLANRLAERGVQVRLIVPDYAAESPVSLDPRVELSVVTTAGPRPLRRPAYFLSLAHQAAANADLVLANYYPTTYPALVSWLLHGRRAALAYNVRGYEPWSHGLMAPAGRISRGLRYALARFSYRLPFTRLVTTEWLKRMVGDQRAIVVGHGIDLRTFRPDAQRSRDRGMGSRESGAGQIHFSGSEKVERRIITVGVIGRSGAVKGYPDFLSAVELLPEQASLNVLVVLADQVSLPRRYPAEGIVAETEVEMASFYNRCEVFVFPSLAEGFGLPPLEAMACGCAVVTTDCGGVAAFARDEQNCLMVAPGRPELLARAIERLVTEPALRTRLAESGIETARRFDRSASLDRLADRLIDLAAER